jgi:hypothetical protein
LSGSDRNLDREIAKRLAEAYLEEAEVARNANRMTEAVLKLAGVFKSHAAVTVTYSRPSTGQSVDGLVATIGMTEWQIVESDGRVVGYESRDYFFTAADLAFASGSPLGVPLSGDTITEANGAVYRVSIPKPNKEFKNFGPNNEAIMVYTKGPQ